MTTIAQQSLATSGQMKQINRLVSDAVEKILADLRLDNPGAQRVIEHGDELVAAITAVLTASLQDLSVTDEYKNEEVKSSYGYPNGYKPKGITEQTNILRQVFPGVGFAIEKLAEAPLPQHAESFFAIPKWQTIAPTYGEAVAKVFEAIAKQRKFDNYREGPLGSEKLRQSKRTVAFFAKLAAEQPDHDILVVPAQF